MPSPVPSYLSSMIKGSRAEALIGATFFSVYCHQNRRDLALLPLYVGLVKEASLRRAASVGQGKAPRISDRLQIERGERARQDHRKVSFACTVDRWVTVESQLYLGATY